MRHCDVTPFGVDIVILAVSFSEIFGLRFSINRFLTSWGAVRMLPILPLIKIHNGVIEPAFLARYLIHVAMREFLSVLAWMRTEALARSI